MTNDMTIPTVRHISATEAKNRFGEVIREAHQREHHLIVERDGIPVIAIVPVREYQRLIEAGSSVQTERKELLSETIPNSDHPQSHPLLPLTGLSDQELAALARAVVAPEHQNQLAAALEQNRSPSLSAEERLSLDELLDHLLAEIDQVALLKARALYTLQLRRNSATKAA